MRGRGRWPASHPGDGHRRATGWWFLLVLAAGPASAAGPAAELRKVHALLVVDTLSGLGESVKQDGERVDRLLSNNLPPDRVEIRILTGKSVNADAILAYYRDLNVGRDDALFFYYAGHGATDPKRGQFLALQGLDARPLPRDELRRAMGTHRPGLVVIVTDCCSSRFKLPGKYRRVIPDKGTAATIHPVLRCLLYQSRGVVDITAASGNDAFGDDHDGGIFTRAFEALVMNRALRSDADRGVFVSWPEFFSRLRTATESTFMTWAHHQRALGQAIDQPTQRPYAFSLGGEDAVTLRNESRATLAYQFRWAGRAAWEAAAIAPGGVRRHAPPESRGIAPPALEIRFEGGKVVELQVGKTYRFHETR